MSRRELLQQQIGLGTAWQPRAGWFEHHPAVLARAALLERKAETETETETAPIAESAPEVAPIAAPLIAPIPQPPAPEPAMPATAQETPMLDWTTLQRQVAACQGCRLCQTRTQTVFGRGNPKARWLLIGEAPGEQEDKQGQPFVGRAGQLLDNMLAAAGLNRDHDVYIANVLKCRPPGNRNPAEDEIAACAEYLAQQVRHIQPTLIVALGRFAAQTLLNSEQGIGQLRGRAHHYQGIPLIVSYHPAYLLRNQADKAKAWQDLLLAQRTFQQHA